MRKSTAAILFTGVIALSCLAGCSSKSENVAPKEENTVGIANPWVDIDENEAAPLCENLFMIPEGATNARWSKCESLGDPDKGIGPLVQADFVYDDMEFCARAQQGAMEDSDISGVYADWAVGPEEATLSTPGGGSLPGRTYRAIDEEGYRDLITWYDSGIPAKYSLTVEAPDLDGFDIQAVAEQMLRP